MSFLKNVNRPVVVLISQTGSEIVALANHYKCWPDAIVIHNNSRLNLLPELRNLPGIYKYTLPDRPSSSDYSTIFNQFKDPIIILSGYQRIVPPDICDQYEIFNGHPGDIITYPELKGRDPQERVIGDPNYPFIGSVVHKVTSSIDDGEIVAVERVQNPLSRDCVYSWLKQTSLDCWKTFFDNYPKLPGIVQTIPVAFLTEKGSSIEEGSKSESLLPIELVEKKYPETAAEFKRLQQSDYLLFCKKQLDYGPGNISIGSTLETDEDKRVSQCSVIFRMYDKVQRLMNLVVKAPATIPSNEPIVDSYQDISNFGIIARIVKNGKWAK